MCVYVYVRVYVYLCVYMCMHMHRYLYIHICIYANPHIPAPSKSVSYFLPMAHKSVTCPAPWASSIPSLLHGPQVTFLTPEVREGHILQRNLPQEVWVLTARIPCHNLPLPKPVTQPGQLTVAVERIGQEVSERGRACGHEGTFLFSVSLTGSSSDHTAPTANNLLSDQLLRPEKELAVERTRRIHDSPEGALQKLDPRSPSCCWGSR